MKTYNPPRNQHPAVDETLEVELVYKLRSCGTCSFFWPNDPTTQPYGPYPAYDFTANYPEENAPKGDETSFPWVKGQTVDQAFPNGEVMDGCRKAPIMTIGINPNMTAFAPGLTGTSWAYPKFTSDDKTDAWTKYAQYYRYRSVYQEHFSLDFMKQFLLKDGQIIAKNDGEVKAAERKSEKTEYNVEVKYADGTEESIHLAWDIGTPRYVLLFDHFGPNNAFKKGDIIAAKLDVPAGENVQVFQEQIGYYEQFVPPLDHFNKFLQQKHNEGIDLKIGEDVGQLDMVACASPHWNESFLGGQEETIVGNCVKQNAWAMKQLVQTKPAVLYLVGEASYNMFHDAFSNHLSQKDPIPEKLEDGAFELLKRTSGPNNPLIFSYEGEAENFDYSIETRIVVSPHFSYNSNFVPQYRMDEADWSTFKTKYAKCYQFFDGHKDVTITPGNDYSFNAIQINGDTEAIFKALSDEYADAYKFLGPFFYDAHKTLADVLIQLYDEETLTVEKNKDGKNILTRSDGSCNFCVNTQWEFPAGCPYGKNLEKAPPSKALSKIASQIARTGSE